MTKIISFDTETFYDADLTVTKLGNWKYTHDPRAACYLISVCDGATAWAGSPKDFDFSQLEGAVVLSHNAAFDQEVFRAHVERGEWPDVKPAAWHCTANMSAYLCNRRSLAEAAEFLLQKGVSKGMRDWMKGRTWDDAVREGKAEELLQYARDDAQLCWELFDKHGARWPEWERRLSDLTIEQGRRGVHIHQERLQAGIVLLQRVILAATDMLPWVKTGRAPASPHGVAEACRAAGIAAPPVKAHDADAAAEWEEEHSHRFPWIKALKDLRKAKKTLATLETMKERIREDGTMGFSLKYFGAHCVPGDHEVLTRDGWKRIDEWTEQTDGYGDIMQYTETGELEFAPAKPNRFDNVEEPLLRCRTGQVDFAVTPGHWCVVERRRGGIAKRQVGEMCKIKGKYLLSAPRKNEASAPLTDAQIRLRVAVQADGHYLTDCRAIRFRFKRLRKIERMRVLLAEAGVENVELRFPSEPDVAVFRLSRFPRWLEDCKQFGVELLEFSQDQLEVFLAELEFWDGYRYGPGSMSYTTTNAQNAEWIQTAAHLSGKAAVIRVLDRNPRWNTAYCVTVREARISSAVKECWFTERERAGTVFCPTARHGTFLTRYNQQICITGNTGRWSGDAGINFQNFNREPLFVRPDYSLEDDRKTINDLIEVFEKNPDDPQLQCVDVRGLLLPPPGMLVGAPDLSQIEPRVLNYIAGNHQLLQKIRDGFPIYEAHARDSMGWTGGKLKSENKKMYSLAKARVLGLGFSCGWEKFITVAKTMANLDITEDDEKVALQMSADGVIYREHEGKPCHPYVLRSVERVDPQTGPFQELVPEPVFGANSRAIVKNFRDNNPLIVGLWRQFQNALEEAVGDDLVIELPSGRKITYRKVRREMRTVTIKDTGEKKAKSVYTAEADGRRKIFYGGLITENCISGSMEILTDRRGWVRLDSLRPDERVWDGEFFVPHQGLSERGHQPVINCLGITCTPDHQFLSEGRWRPASDVAETGCMDVYSLTNGQTYSSSSVVLDRLDRSETRASNNYPARRVQRDAYPVDGALRMWCHGAADSQNVSSGAVLLETVSSVQGFNSENELHARDVAASRLRSLAFYETAVFGPKSSILQKLWRSRNHGVPGMAGVVPSVLGCDGSDVEGGLGFGSNRQRAGVFSRELSLDHSRRELPQPEAESDTGMGSGRVCQEQHRSRHPVLPRQARSSVTLGLHASSEYRAAVFDILNCGPRHRFAVRAPGASHYAIAHNCVQAIARDAFAENMLRILDAGIWPMWSVHDEAVCAVHDADENERARRLMATTPSWLPGCPVESEATLSDRYKK